MLSLPHPAITRTPSVSRLFKTRWVKFSEKTLKQLKVSSLEKSWLVVRRIEAKQIMPEEMENSSGRDVASNMTDLKRNQEESRKIKKIKNIMKGRVQFVKKKKRGCSGSAEAPYENADIKNSLLVLGKNKSGDKHNDVVESGIIVENKKVLKLLFHHGIQSSTVTRPRL